MVEASNSRLVDVEKSLSFPLGAMSPLWLAFAGAAATGAAYFWMSRWATRPVNLEAQFAARDLPATPELPDRAPVAGAMIEAAAAVVEPALEIAKTATETVMQSAIEQSAALAEAFDPVEPIAEPLAKTAPEVDDAADAATQAARREIDDLTRLVGVGPKLAASLAERGVRTFAQIAAWTPQELDEIDQALDLRGRAVRDAWIAQARRFADTASPNA